ncbi:MAG: flagellar hook capping FlgD N-terminal domain-containing protein [Lachnospiraceae bacterium]|nr:flagellar hook capping FlgD N-terminal domain-containing protein [Lachnospiraceae bacterium]MDY4096728.1 flagellar hook capping FlgD N-terminal domain-containing protein [Lachnospiraceae bacterium]
MSVIAEVKDGKLVQQSMSSSKEKEKRASNTLDKDAFLQLLVAQMKYQDPLEPTSNTEYISQLATFSSLEEMQNLNSAMTLQRASQLVGQYVFMKVTDSNGKTTYPEGTVDYVVYENNKAFLSINDTLYSIDDLETVADAGYVVAIKKAESFVEAMNKLPNPKYVTRDDGEKLGNLIISYEAMSDYQKNFLSDDTVKLYSEYFNQYQTHIVEPVSNFIKKMESLPGVDELTEDNLDELKSIVGTYDDFTAYQKTLIASDALELFGKLKTKYEELTATT